MPAFRCLSGITSVRAGYLSVTGDAKAAAFPANRVIVFGDRAVTNNAVAVAGDARSLTSNHGLARANPLERYYRDVWCGARSYASGRRDADQRRAAGARDLKCMQE